jgi:transcriptional regulator GlxA family with amidase domain
VAAGGLRVLSDVTLESCPALQALVVPGGTRVEMSNQRLLTWIAERARQVETLTSVCTGAMLLGQAALLDGRRATTHWRSLDWMRRSFPAVTVEDASHVVEDGNRAHVGRDLGRHRHGPARRRALFRRVRRPRDRAAHGVPVSGG